MTSTKMRFWFVKVQFLTNYHINIENELWYSWIRNSNVIKLKIQQIIVPILWFSIHYSNHTQSVLHENIGNNEKKIQHYILCKFYIVTRLSINNAHKLIFVYFRTPSLK